MFIDFYVAKVLNTVQVCVFVTSPLPSMYDIFAYIWLIYMVFMQVNIPYMDSISHLKSSGGFWKD